MDKDESIKFKRFESLVETNSDLRSCVLDANLDEDSTLVVLCGCNRKLSAVKTMIRENWDSDFEVYRPSDLPVGSKDIPPSFSSKLLH